MAFMGIFLFGWLALLIFMIFLFAILFVFTPCLIIFIINLVQGIIHKWPKRNLILVIITGIVLSVFVTIGLGLLLLSLIAKSGSTPTEISEAALVMSLYYLLA